MSNEINNATFKVAAVQATPVFLDREATIDKACGLIATAGSEGARLIVFPEAFIPTYPEWIWGIPPGEQGDGSTLQVYDTPLGKLGGLICWENYMPLARYALYA